jgi:hypothetical protein
MSHGANPMEMTGRNWKEKRTIAYQCRNCIRSVSQLLGGGFLPSYPPSVSKGRQHRLGRR